MKTLPPLGSRRVWILGAILVAALLALGPFRRQIDLRFESFFLLRTESPNEEVFNELAAQYADPAPFLESCWATGAVLHHQYVAAYLLRSAAANPSWFAEAEHLAVSGVSDPDMSVRELAHSTLDIRKDPRIFACACAQLTDPDPLVRQLGLRYLEHADRKKTVPEAIRLLDDPDVRVSTSAEVTLMHWTGQDFGVRNAMVMGGGETAQPGGAAAANLEKIQQGIERRKQWWRDHAGEYSDSARVTNVIVRADAPTSKPLADFTLKNLDGQTVELARFRGKTVVLNFWATWCTACVAEIPDLIALQKVFGDQVVILGVALDGVPDDDGDVHGTPLPSLDAIRDTVRRAVRSRGIDYIVLLDPDGAVAKRFNGGELPTTIIIDAAGRMRRRFIGERDVKVFEAMIAEASQPPVH